MLSGAHSKNVMDVHPGLILPAFLEISYLSLQAVVGGGCDQISTKGYKES